MRDRHAWQGPVPRGNDSTDGDYSARSRLADERTRRTIKKVTSTWEAIPFGSIINGQRAVADGTYTFGVYATGGVTIPGTSGATAVAMEPWTDGAGTVYLFQFDAGTHKMLVTDWMGNQIAAGVDLSAITAQPYRATLSAILVPSAQSRLTGSGRVTAVEFEPGTAFTADNANYWTLTAYLRRADLPRPDTIGVTLGSFSTQKRSIAALSRVSLYSRDTGPGALFADRDAVVVSAAATGNPLPIYGGNAWARIDRDVT